MVMFLSGYGLLGAHNVEWIKARVVLAKEQWWMVLVLSNGVAARFFTPSVKDRVKGGGN